MPHPRPRKNLQALRRRRRRRRHRPRARRGRGARHHRAERRRQDHAVRHHRPAPSRPTPAACIFDGADITRATPERRCRLGIARSFQIPQPFGGMTVFENLVVAAAFGGGKRERDVYGRCAELLDAMRPRRQGQPAGRRAHAARPQAARACARARDRAARAAARRSRRRPDRARDRSAGGADQGGARDRRVDHLDRARGACADRGGRPAAWCCTAAR